MNDGQGLVYPSVVACNNKWTKHVLRSTIINHSTEACERGNAVRNVQSDGKCKGHLTYFPYPLWLRKCKTTTVACFHFRSENGSDRASIHSIIIFHSHWPHIPGAKLCSVRHPPITYNLFNINIIYSSFICYLFKCALSIRDSLCHRLTVCLSNLAVI